MKAHRVGWRIAVLALVVSVGIVGVWVQFCAAQEKPAAGAPEVAAMDRARQASLRASCQNNLKQLGIIFKLFANESKGECFPRLSSEPGRLMFANETTGIGPVYPEYMTDMSVMLCPADPRIELLKKPEIMSDPKILIDDLSYFYLGYAVTSEADVKAFAEAYKTRMTKGLKFDEDLDTPQGTLYMLRRGIERLFNPNESAQRQSEIPILIERLGHHEPEGGNVLYLDGHVEFIRFDTKWPMTKATLDVLKSLDELKPAGK